MTRGCVQRQLTPRKYLLQGNYLQSSKKRFRTVLAVVARAAITYTANWVAPQQQKPVSHSP